MDMPRRICFYIGGYTTASGGGIYQSDLDISNGSLSQPVLVARLSNPSFIQISPSGRFLYSVIETGDFEGQCTGGVASFAILPDQTLKLMNQRPSGGPGACHLSIMTSLPGLLVANYGGGNVMAYSLNPDGSIGTSCGIHQHKGSGPDPQRQSRAFAHCFVPCPFTDYALSADLGCDRIFIYGVQQTLTLQGSYAVPPGSGPRHMVFHPSKPTVYLVNELSSTILVLGWNSTSATLTQLQEISTIPAGFEGKSTAAEIAVHPNGKYVYSSNRGHDSIVTFAVDSGRTTLEYVCHTSTLGRTPRHFSIDPTGSYLLVANQDSGTIVSFRVDPLTGIPEPAGHEATVATPTCIRFIPLAQAASTLF